MRRQYCPSASLFQRFSHHLRNQAGAMLIIALLVSLTRPALKEAYADGGQPALYVRTVLAALRAAKDDLVAAKPLISSNPFNADRLAIKQQIDKLKAVEEGLCKSYPEECHPDAEDLAKPPQLTVDITDPNVVAANNAAKAGQEILKKYQNLSGISSDKRASIDHNLGELQTVTACTITITQPSGGVTALTSDKNPFVNITANIPLASGASVNVLLDGTVVSSLSPKGTIWVSSQFHLDGTGKTAGTTSVITVTGTAGDPPATCTSTNSVTVNWKAPPKPVITTFGALPLEIEPPTTKTSVLGWAITDADTASIDQGVGAVNAKTGAKGVSPEQGTTYTLTAIGPGGTATATTEVKVKKQPPPPLAYTITLESSGGGNLATTDQVTVDGKVTPTPPQGTTESVAIGVNGKPVMTVPVASDGSFVAVVALENKTTLDDLELFNDDVDVATCGGVASDVDLYNAATEADTKNFIEAAVVAPGGGVASNTASVVIYHGVRVIDTEIRWSGQCPGPAKDKSGGPVLGPGDIVTVGIVDCGVECPGHGVKCTATATATVTTTVGEISASGFWNIDIQ